MQEVNYQIVFKMSQQKNLYIISSLFFTITFSSAQMRSEKVSIEKPDTINTPSFVNRKEISLTDSIVNYGKLFLKTPYHYGSHGSDTFDCSGFTSYVYRNFGYDLQRSSAEQAQQFDSVDRTQLKKGDLVFFSGRRRSRKVVGHVGIVTAANGNGQFEFIHAAVQSGVTISNSEEPYYTKRFIKANRVIYTNPLLAVTSKSTVVSDTSREQKTTTPFTVVTTQTRKVIPALYHRVKSGETLSDIAYKYGISLAELKQMNKLKKNKIQIKQQLKVKKEETFMDVEPMNEIVQKTPEKQNKLIELNGLAKNDTISTRKSPTTHKVQKGETLFSISKLYNVSVEELKTINKIQNAVIKPNQILILNITTELSTSKTTNKLTEATNKPFQISYKVKKGETLTSISKRNNIPIDMLKRINHLETSKLKPGQKIIISQNEDSTFHQPVVKKDITTKSMTYKVKSGESLYSISKKYKISIDDLKKINQLVENKIKPQQELQIPLSTEQIQNSTSVKSENINKQIIHKVKSGETFISIAKTYNCTVKKLKEWNNKKDSKIKIGEKLIIHS